MYKPGRILLQQTELEEIPGAVQGRLRESPREAWITLGGAIWMSPASGYKVFICGALSSKG